MKRFIIEREIPGASDSAKRSWPRSHASPMTRRVPGRAVHWMTSYVAGDKMYCIHEAEDEEAIREHARRGGFPANVVSAVADEFGPHTAG